MGLGIDVDKFIDTFGQALKAAQNTNPRYKHDIIGLGTPSTNLIHGPNGLFGYPGIERDVFSTRVRPRGLLEALPSRGSNDVYPIVGYLLGFTDDESGTEKATPCADPLMAGEIKSCLQGALFGRVERKTDTLELNKLGARVNRGEMFDLRLVNDPLLQGNLLSMPSSIPQEFGRILSSEVLARWMTLGVAFERKLGPLVYSGSPANNVGTGYAEYHGLETLVGTGKIDVITGTTCPGLDSYVRNASYRRVELNGSYYVQLFIDAFRQMRHRASHMGLDPVTWIIVMREGLFDALADIWPCAYNTYRCQASNVQDSTITQVVVDAAGQRAMSEAMRNGKYLLIDGVRYPVVTDDFIPEDTNTNNANVVSGCFGSDIYILPMTVRGGIVSTYFEFFDYAAPGAAISQAEIGRLTGEYWTDGGRFLWTTQRTGWCVEWWAKIEPRLRLLTPHLAARISNVVYCPVQHYREDDPTNAYFADGGETDRTFVPYDTNDFPAAG